MNDDVGKKLKAVRNAKKITLKDLSEKSGLSIGYLSQLERGISSISMNQLNTLAKCLDVDVMYFISDDSKNSIPVMKSFENSVLFIESDLSFQYKITNSFTNKTMLPKIDVIMPGFVTEDIHCHQGEEFLYVLEGILTLDIDGTIYRLYPGDTAHYNALKVHKWRNETNKPVKTLVVSTPNPFSVPQ